MASADELRRRREDESAFAFLYDMAREQNEQLAAEGRRPVFGGLLSVGNFGAGADKMDVLRDIDFEGVGSGLLGLLSPVARAIDAPISAYRGTIPQEDMLNEAMNVTGMAMAGGGAIASPQGALASNALRRDFVEPGKQFMRPMPDPDNDRFAPSDIVMAQRILDMRADGRASEVTDEMMTQADPAFMFDNTPLPMDAAARMERAQAAGFDADGYHGTVVDHASLKPSVMGKHGPGVYTADGPEFAGDFAGKMYGKDEYLDGGKVLPMSIRSNPAPDEYRANAEALKRSAANPFDGAGEFTGYLDDNGFTGVKVGNEQTTVNPANMRSQFARFDPEFAHLRNLSSANASTSGGLLATATSNAERMAQRILELRAAGRASEVTDEMMAQADPQYMFKNTPLPKDEAARAARAEAAGFDVSNPVFHGGASGIKAMDADVSQGKDFDTGVWTTSDRYNANRYAGSRTEGKPKVNDGQNWPIYDDRGSVYPLFADTSGYGETDFKGRNWGDAPEGAVIRGGGQPSQRISEVREDWQSWPNTAEAVRAARDTGRRGLVIKDVVDIGDNFPHKDHIGLGSEISNDVVAIDPTTLRSRFARFDPEFAHLANLNAANASTVGGLLAQSGVSDKQAEKIETYLKKVGLLQ